MSGAENLRLFPRLFDMHRSNPYPLLRIVGLGSRADDRVETYSKGMKQRLMGARALVNRPRILFLDEPTAGLDPTSAEGIRNLILRVRKRGTTILLTTHDMVEADKLSNRVAFINRGKIVALDKPHNLKQRYGKRALRVEVSGDHGALREHEVVLDAPETAQSIEQLFASENVGDGTQPGGHPGGYFHRDYRAQAGRMNFGIIRTLVTKDLILFLRNRFFALITVLGIAVYIVIYFVMLGTVDETMEVGLYAPVLPPVFEEAAGEGIVFQDTASEEALRQAVEAGQYAAGVALPADIMEKLDSGGRPVVSLYFRGDASDEVKDTLEAVIRELAYLQAGQSLAIDTTTEVLGTDMMGEQIPLRDRLRPLFAVLIVLFETMGLASLISDEVARGTVRAVLVTPARVQDLFAAKAFVGVTLAFGQALLVTAIVGGLTTQPLIVVTALLLGAVLVTGFAFLIASLARDMMSAMGWSMIVMVILMVPAFGLLFPGTSTRWARAIPSHYMAETIYQASSYGAGWADVWQNRALLAGFDMAAVAAGQFDVVLRAGPTQQLLRYCMRALVDMNAPWPMGARGRSVCT